VLSKRLAATLAGASALGVVGVSGCSLILGLKSNSADMDAGVEGVDSGRRPHDAAVRDTSHHEAAAHDVGPSHDAACCTCTGGTELGARCLVTLVADAGFPVAILVDEGSVYWANFGNPTTFTLGSIMKAGSAPDDGRPVTTLAPGQPRPFRIAIENGDMYWIDRGNPDASLLAPPRIARVSLEGAGYAVLTTSVSNPFGIGLNDAGVYWTNNGPVSADIERVALDGGIATTLVAGPSDTAWAMAADGTGNIYWTINNGTDGSVWVLWADGHTTSLAAGQDGAWALTVGNGHVYWATRGTDGGASPTVMSVTPEAGVISVLATPSGGFPYSITVDTANLYWTDVARNLVMRVGLDGGIATTLATRPDASGPSSIAVDDASVYWTEVYGGKIMKLTPK